MNLESFLKDMDDFLASICRGADVLFLTPFRDYAVLDGAATDCPGMGIHTGNVPVDVGTFGVGFTLSAGLEMLRHYMQQRNARLQLNNGHYFLQKMLYLYAHLKQINNNTDVNDLNILENLENLQAFLYYFGDHVIAPNQWWRRHFDAKKFSQALLALEKNSKNNANLVDSAMKIFYEKFSSEKINDEGNCSPSSSESQSPEQKNKLNRHIFFSQLVLNVVWSAVDMAWSSLFRYMMAYWVLWYAVWAITGLTAVGGVVAVGLSFGAPLIPVAIYLLSRVLKKNEEKKSKSWEYFYHRHVFIKTYFAGLQQISDEKIQNLKELYGYELSVEDPEEDAAKKILLQKLHHLNNPHPPILPTPLSKTYVRSLLTTFFSSLIVGTVLTEFGAWPVLAFLGTIGVAAAGGPFSIAIIAGVALGIGLYIAVKNTYRKHKEQSDMEKLRIIHDYKVMEYQSNEQQKPISPKFKRIELEHSRLENDEDYVRIETIYKSLQEIENYELENKVLEEQLSILFQKITELHQEKVDPIEALSNISQQERFYRRMSLESTPRTNLKKALHAAFVGVASAGTGILLIRLFFGIGCVFALHNPILFLGLAAIAAVLWSGYKIYEHFKDRKDLRSKYFIETSDLRLTAAKEKNIFLRKQYNGAALLCKKLEEQKPTSEEPVDISTPNVPIDQPSSLLCVPAD